MQKASKELSKLMNPSHSAEAPDVREKGAPGKDGTPQTSDKRLYFQLSVFTGCLDLDAVEKAVKASGFEAVLYEDFHDARGFALLLMHENPDFFVREARAFLQKQPFSSLTYLRDMTMAGRSYSLGRELDLEDWLLQKPRRTALNPAWPWAIWYPLRRKPEFELLSKEEQGKILYEHAKIGMSYGRADLAHDIRLACYGIDRDDNEFLIGLIGRELFPLSHVVEEMRKTQQTARYIESLGPFFTGRVRWQSPAPLSPKPSSY